MQGYRRRHLPRYHVMELMQSSMAGKQVTYRTDTPASMHIIKSNEKEFRITLKNISFDLSIFVFVLKASVDILF